MLMSMPAATADQEVNTLMSRLNFTSTYAFGKLLAEMMFDDPSVLPGVGKCIVRPSLITGVAGAPYPGYFNGFAGCQGYCLGGLMFVRMAVCSCALLGMDACVNVCWTASTWTAST